MVQTANQYIHIPQEDCSFRFGIVIIISFWVVLNCAEPSFSPPARWGLLDFMSVASSCLLPPASSSSSSSSPPRPPRPPCHPCRPCRLVLAQLRPAIHSVLCRTSTTTSHTSVPCRTSTTTSHAQCSLPALICEYPCQVFPAGPQPRARRYAR